MFSPSHFVSPVKLQKSPCLGNCRYDAAQSVQNSPSLILSLRHGTAPRADLFGASHFGASSYFDEDLGTEHYNKWDAENLWEESEEEAKNGEDFKDREVEDREAAESVLTCGLQSIAGALPILADAGQHLTLSPEKSVQGFGRSRRVCQGIAPTKKAGQALEKHLVTVKRKGGGFRFCQAWYLFATLAIALSLLTVLIPPHLPPSYCKVLIYFTTALPMMQPILASLQNFVPRRHQLEEGSWRQSHCTRRSLP